jgi:esterase/lipase superfamily enzyme
LRALGQPFIVFPCSRGRYFDYEGLGMVNAEDTRALEHIFPDKGIRAWMDYWGYDVNRDWPWWYQQMNYFLGRFYNNV